MSRRARLSGAISLFALALSFTGLAAMQESSLREVEIVEQLDRLQAHYRELRSADAELDAILRAEWVASQSFEVDSVSVGPFVVVATPEQIDEAVEVYSSAWVQLEAMLPGWSPSDSNYSNILPFLRTTGRYPGDSRGGVYLRPWYPKAMAEERALWVIETRVFLAAMPHELRTWAPELGVTNRERLEFAYRNLIITAAESARDCFEGESDRCWDALGLRNTEASWASWYDADERRQWAWKDSGTDRICSTDPECLYAVRTRRADAPIPAEPFTRASFLGHALRVGGEGAIMRFNAGVDGTSLADRLTSAAGVTPDALVDSWRQEVIAAAPPSQTGLSLKLLSGALLWSLVFSGFSMRSTRWRA